MNKVAVCIHDLRISQIDNIIETVEMIRNAFCVDLVTVHVVFDEDITLSDEFFQIWNEVQNNKLEIVFHGIHHYCPHGTWRWLAWYHKYEAEFIGDSFDEITNRRRYWELNYLFSTFSGFCPSCWIASKKGRRFIKSLIPAYIEKLVCLRFPYSFFFSLPISLATLNRVELFFLRILASIFTFITGIFNRARTRLVIHTIDFQNPDSIELLRKKFCKLKSKGFIPTLQRDLRQ